MKNFFLATAVLAIASLTAQAGRLVGVTFAGPSTVTVMGGYAQPDPLQYTTSIVNNSGRQVRLGFQRQIRYEVPGSENNFCFGVNCYPATVTTSPAASPVVLNNGGTDNSMVLDYTPNNMPGVTTIRYALYEQGGADSTYLLVHFNATQRLLANAASQTTESILSQPFPNPAAAGTAPTMHFRLPVGSTGAHLVLVSLADGRRIQRVLLPIALAEGIVRIPTDGLAAGLYTCLLISGADGRSQLLAARRLQVE